MLNKLQKAIHQLKEQKDELLKKIQSYGWKEDRLQRKIPEKHEIDVDIMIGIKTLEKRLLSSDVKNTYQHRYSACRTILEKNQLGRVGEFETSYSPAGKNTEVGIKQLLSSRYVTKDDQFRLMDLINHQFDILSAVPSHLQYSLYDVELSAYSILMDDEIMAARHLLENGFLRPAGALAGVILERHLKNLLRKHTPPIKFKEKDTLSTLNDLCKDTVYDLIVWRKVQHLTDLRNLCDHANDREPSKAEVKELIKGVAVMLKNHN